MRKLVKIKKTNNGKLGKTRGLSYCCFSTEVMTFPHKITEVGRLSTYTHTYTHTHTHTHKFAFMHTYYCSHTNTSTNVHSGFSGFSIEWIEIQRVSVVFLQRISIKVKRNL